MEDKLYEKIGRQEIIIEALRKQSADLSNLLSKFVSGEEKPANWEITPDGQLIRKAAIKPGKQVSRH
jgi:hypothetical protein